MQILIISLFTAALGLARDIYVAPGGTNNPPYASWPDAATNIEWAVNAGTNGDSVWISNGVYVLTNQITVRSNLAICGTGGVVVVDGNNSSRCFYFNSVSGSLANLFITRGYTNSDHGGGVFAKSSKITVQDCVFSNNTMTSINYGGGLALWWGTATVQRCAFVGNYGGRGGGLAIVQTATVVRVERCMFDTNAADSHGGGFYDQSALTVITGCDFICNVVTGTQGLGGGCCLGGTMTHSRLVSNVASRAGGGVFGGRLITNCWFSNNISGVINSANACGGGAQTGGKVRNCVFACNRFVGTTGNTGGGGISPNAGASIYDCVIEGNTSDVYGGGLWITESDVEIRNCLIQNNVAGPRFGGGIAVWFEPPGNVTIGSCTIVSNAASNGGGLAVLGSLNGVPFVENTIIYDNTGSLNSNYYFSSSPATVFTNCCLSPALPAGITNVNTITGSPQFVDGVASDYRLTRSSPCVNAGVIRPWMTDANDLDGRPRLDRFSGRVDVGCYEYLPIGALFGVR